MKVGVLIIGAGQAGLALGYFLKQKNVSFVMVAMGRSVGEVWRDRYDSLVLFTPRSHSGLPGMDLNGNRNEYATKDEIAHYLTQYVIHFELPIHFNTEVISLEKMHDGFRVISTKGEYFAKKVVVATGPFQKPFIPKLTDSFTDNILQIHTSSYRNSSQLQDGPVLVVGGGNSGAQIAVELSSGRDVYLSVGHKMKFLPLQILGKSIFWWFDLLGILDTNINSKLGQLISKQSDPIFGLELKKLISKGRVHLKPRTKSMGSDMIYFDDHTNVKVSNIIWATGFYSDYSWIRIPNILGKNGKPRHHRGVSSVQDLFFLGLPWQYKRGSGLIGGVGEDAEYLMNAIMG